MEELKEEEWEFKNKIILPILPHFLEFATHENGHCPSSVIACLYYYCNILSYQREWVWYTVLDCWVFHNGAGGGGDEERGGITKKIEKEMRRTMGHMKKALMNQDIPLSCNVIRWKLRLFYHNCFLCTKQKWETNLSFNFCVLYLSWGLFSCKVFLATK